MKSPSSTTLVGGDAEAREAILHLARRVGRTAEGLLNGTSPSLLRKSSGFDLRPGVDSTSGPGAPSRTTIRKMLAMTTIRIASATIFLSAASLVAQPPSPSAGQVQQALNLIQQAVNVHVGDGPGQAGGRAARNWAQQRIKFPPKKETFHPFSGRGEGREPRTKLATHPDSISRTPTSTTATRTTDPGTPSMAFHTRNILGCYGNGFRSLEELAGQILHEYYHDVQQELETKKDLPPEFFQCWTNERLLELPGYCVELDTICKLRPGATPANQKKIDETKKLIEARKEEYRDPLPPGVRDSIYEGVPPDARYYAIRKENGGLLEVIRPSASSFVDLGFTALAALHYDAAADRVLVLGEAAGGAGRLVLMDGATEVILQEQNYQSMVPLGLVWDLAAGRLIVHDGTKARLTNDPYTGGAFPTDLTTWYEGEAEGLDLKLPYQISLWDAGAIYITYGSLEEKGYVVARTPAGGFTATEMAGAPYMFTDLAGFLFKSVVGDTEITIQGPQGEQFEITSMSVDGVIDTITSGEFTGEDQVLTLANPLQLGLRYSLRVDNEENSWRLPNRWVGSDPVLDDGRKPRHSIDWTYVGDDVYTSVGIGHTVDRMTAIVFGVTPISSVGVAPDGSPFIQDPFGTSVIPSTLIPDESGRAEAVFSTAIPNDPALSGQTLIVQWAFEDGDGAFKFGRVSEQVIWPVDPYFDTVDPVVGNPDPSAACTSWCQALHTAGILQPGN